MTTLSPRTGHTQRSSITLYFEDWGQTDHPAILLVMGLSGQLIFWPDVLVQGLVAAGFRVIRFDNRDIGWSGKVTHRARLPMHRLMLRSTFGLSIEAPYTLHDMALDACALLRELQIHNVHLVGVSMGGMIAQIMAAYYPDLVASLTLLMTSDLSPLFSIPPDPAMLWTMLSGGFGGRKAKGLERPRPEDIAKFMQRLAGRRYYTNFQDLVQRSRLSLERSYHPPGVARQLLAILATGQLSSSSRRIRCPVQVIHGLVDPLVHWKAGQRLGRLIPGAKFHPIPGLGHTLPISFMPELQKRILEHISSASVTVKNRF